MDLLSSLLFSLIHVHQQFNTALIKLARDIGLWYVKAAELCVSNPNSNFEFTKLIRIGIVLKTKYHMHSGIV